MQLPLCSRVTAKIYITGDERLMELDRLRLAFLLPFCFRVALYVLDSFIDFDCMVLGTHSHVPKSTLHLDDRVS